MQNLFNLIPSVEQGITKFPMWEYVRDGLRRNLDTVIRFYRSHTMAVDSSHLLAQILETITVPQSMSLDRYYANVDAMSLNVSMALKLTSPVFKGKVFNGVFYGPGNTEIIIGHDESFDVEEIHENWQEAAAVKVLRHSISNLGLNIPDGKTNDSERGIAVIAINIPMLAVQYRAFRLAEGQLVHDTGDSERSVMNFIHMFVLPNMLPTHLDHVIMNRLINLQNGDRNGYTLKKHSFYLTDFTPRVDYVQIRLLEMLKGLTRNITGTLRSIPLVSQSTAEELMYFPDFAPLRQILWAIVAARIHIFDFVYSVSKSMQGEMNASETNRVLRILNAYGIEYSLRSSLPLEYYMQIMNQIDKIARQA